MTPIKKTELDLPALFTREGPAKLHVVTCGGNFDEEKRHYDENVVVVANSDAVRGSGPGCPLW